jgi:hypothetical protein
MHKSEVLSIDYFLNSFVSLAHRIGRVRGSAACGFLSAWYKGSVNRTNETLESRD